MRHKQEIVRIVFKKQLISDWNLLQNRFESMRIRISEFRPNLCSSSFAWMTILIPSYNGLGRNECCHSPASIHQHKLSPCVSYHKAFIFALCFIYAYKNQAGIEMILISGLHCKYMSRISIEKEISVRYNLFPKISYDLQEHYDPPIITRVKKAQTAVKVNAWCEY